jgi:FHS family L-fucose permease-like MFS transporter
MATQRVAASAAATPRPEGAVTAVNYARPLAVVTSLFFMWGFLTSLNDILVPHLKSIFDLHYSQAMLIQFALFSAYFLFSIPWSRSVNRIGYCSQTRRSAPSSPC